MHLIRKVHPKRNKPPSHLSFNRGSPLCSQNKGSSTSTSEKRGKPLSPANRSNKTSTSDINRGLFQSKMKSSTNQSSTSDSTRGSPQSTTKSSTNQSSRTSDINRGLPQSKILFSSKKSLSSTSDIRKLHESKMKASSTTIVSINRGLPQSKSSSSLTSYIRGVPQSKTKSSVTSDIRGLPQSKTKASSPPSTSDSRGLPRSTMKSSSSKKKRSISPESFRDNSCEKLSTSFLEKDNNQESNKSVSCKRTKIDAGNKALSDKGEMTKLIPVQRSFNEMLHEQFKDMNIYHKFNNWLTESLLKSFGGSHVNQVLRKDISDYAEESGYNDDDLESFFEYHSSNNDDGGPYHASMNKYKNISKTNKLISEDDCKLVLKLFLI